MLTTCVQFLALGTFDRCTIEDGSSQALMFINDDCCRRWLKFPASVWKVLVEQVLPHQGEFLYVGSVSLRSLANLWTCFTLLFLLDRAENGPFEYQRGLPHSFLLL